MCRDFYKGNKDITCRQLNQQEDINKIQLTRQFTKVFICV